MGHQGNNGKKGSPSLKFHLHGMKPCLSGNCLNCPHIILMRKTWKNGSLWSLRSLALPLSLTLHSVVQLLNFHLSILALQDWTAFKTMKVHATAHPIPPSVKPTSQLSIDIHSISTFLSLPLSNSSMIFFVSSRAKILSCQLQLPRSASVHCRCAPQSRFWVRSWWSLPGRWSVPSARGARGARAPSPSSEVHWDFYCYTIYIYLWIDI